MKKIFAILGVVFITTSIFSQTTNLPPTTIKTDYLKKSKKLNTTGRIILGSGLALSSIGITVGIKNDLEAIGYALIGQRKVNNTGIVLFTTGLIFTAGSLPLFIASGKNKKKAINLALKNEPVLQLSKQNLVYSTVPSVSLKIGL